jgi:hypothetical protein
MTSAIAPLVILVALLWLVSRAYRDWWFLVRPRQRALGTVVGHRRISGEGGEMISPVIRFEADDGRIIDVTDSFNVWPTSEGSTIGIEYPSGHPQKARTIGSRPSLLDYGLCLVVLIIAIACMAYPYGW